MRGRPIPIPTLDEFILLHKVLRAALRLQPDMLDMIEGARRAFGWNVLGARAVSGSGLGFWTLGLSGHARAWHLHACSAPWPMGHVWSIAITAVKACCTRWLDERPWASSLGRHAAGSGG